MTDDREALRERLEAVTGERIAALEAVEPERGKSRGAGLEAGRTMQRETGEFAPQDRERSSGPEMEQDRAPKGLDRDMGL